MLFFLQIGWVSSQSGIVMLVEHVPTRLDGWFFTHTSKRSDSDSSRAPKLRPRQTSSGLPHVLDSSHEFKMACKQSSDEFQMTCGRTSGWVQHRVKPRVELPKNCASFLQQASSCCCVGQTVAIYLCGLQRIECHKPWPALRCIKF